MATEQPPPENEQPIKYGDVFFVSDQVANKPILPEDAAAMEAGERAVLGQSPLFGPASIMKYAASINVESGHVGPNSISNEGVKVTDSDMNGIRVVTESVNDEVFFLNLLIFFLISSAYSFILLVIFSFTNKKLIL